MLKWIYVRYHFPTVNNVCYGCCYVKIVSKCFIKRVRDSSAYGLSFSFSLFFFRQIISNGSIKTFEQKCFGGKIELNGIHFVLTTLNEMPPGTIWSLATICLAKYQLPSILRQRNWKTKQSPLILNYVWGKLSQGRHCFGNAQFSNCFPCTLKRKALKFLLQFDERFR